MKSIGSIGLVCLLNGVVSLILSSCNGGFNTSKYDYNTGLWVFTRFDEAPLYNGSKTGFVEHFNQEFNSAGFNIPSRVTLQLVIDKEGNLIDARIYGKKDDDLSTLEKDVVSFALLCKKWSPATIQGVKVNSLLSIPMVLDFR